MIGKKVKARTFGSGPVRVVVIEDNRLTRERLAALLDGHPDFKVAASAACVTSGLASVRETQPHATVVNVALGKGDTLKRIKALAPETRVVLMDVHAVQDDIIAFIRAGATGFILKDATLDDLLRTIRSVGQGADVAPPALTGTLLSHIAQQAVARYMPGIEQAVHMTGRERQIMDLIAEGLSNKEMAQRLSIATYTVKSHVHNILEKLALHSRLQIASHTFARRADPGTGLGRVKAAG